MNTYKGSQILILMPGRKSNSLLKIKTNFIIVSQNPSEVRLRSSMYKYFPTMDEDKANIELFYNTFNEFNLDLEYENTEEIEVVFRNCREPGKLFTNNKKHYHMLSSHYLINKKSYRNYPPADNLHLIIQKRYQFEE